MPDPRLDPEMAAALARMAEIEADLPPMPADPSPTQLRARMEAERLWWNESPPAMHEIVDTSFPGPQGPVPVRLLFPSAERPAAAIVYAHGGGWVVGSLETHRRAMHELALASGACVAAVDYRLAPEHPFPASLNDCIAVVSHIADRGGEVGLDPTRVAIAGDSAGANLAIAAALALAKAGDSPLRSIALIYGAYDPLCDTPSCTEFADGRYGNSTADMRWYWDMYASGADDRANPLYAPALARLSDLPPTHVHAAELDVLRDDSVRLADRLRDVGVPVDLVVHDGVVHSFAVTGRMVSKASRMLETIGAAIRADLSATR